jgi:hypothetical protein
MKQSPGGVKENVEKAASRVEATYNKEVAALKQNNRDLKQKLREYKDRGQSKWIQFKTNIGKDTAGIGKTMKDLFKRQG